MVVVQVSKLGIDEIVIRKYVSFLHLNLYLLWSNPLNHGRHTVVRLLNQINVSYIADLYELIDVLKI